MELDLRWSKGFYLEAIAQRPSPKTNCLAGPQPPMVPPHAHRPTTRSHRRTPSVCICGGQSKGIQRPEQAEEGGNEHARQDDQSQGDRELKSRVLENRHGQLWIHRVQGVGEGLVRNGQRQLPDIPCRDQPDNKRVGLRWELDDQLHGVSRSDSFSEADPDPWEDRGTLHLVRPWQQEWDFEWKHYRDFEENGERH